MDIFSLVNLGHHFIVSQLEPKVLCLLPRPFTLSHIQWQASLTDLAYDSAQMVRVTISAVSVDDHIIQVCSTLVFTVSENMVHKMLEWHSCGIVVNIVMSKWHSCELE